MQKWTQVKPAKMQQTIKSSLVSSCDIQPGNRPGPFCAVAPRTDAGYYCIWQAFGINTAEELNVADCSGQLDVHSFTRLVSGKCYPEANVRACCAFLSCSFASLLHLRAVFNEKINDDDDDDDNDDDINNLTQHSTSPDILDRRIHSCFPRCRSRERRFACRNWSPCVHLTKRLPARTYHWTAR